eukprot:NODE_14922_length_1077_cov_7.252632.p1 GENE.NODE_14922_length_1077_cov_7.252632~~NODE_14922_length_1077_cov_7.252632.p1  ORF type:complete len:236 (-),score=30.82 NODE_14922_length_1077_cov_7.252632:327-1034(-)
MPKRKRLTAAAEHAAPPAKVGPEARAPVQRPISGRAEQSLAATCTSCKGSLLDGGWFCATCSPADTQAPVCLRCASAGMAHERQHVYVCGAGIAKVFSTLPPITAAALDGEHDVTCKVCKLPIRGVRMKCAECLDFDLCAACSRLHGKDSIGHCRSHIFFLVHDSIMPLRSPEFGIFGSLTSYYEDEVIRAANASSGRVATAPAMVSAKNVGGNATKASIIEVDAGVEQYPHTRD